MMMELKAYTHPLVGRWEPWMGQMLVVVAMVGMVVLLVAVLAMGMMNIGVPRPCLGCGLGCVVAASVVVVVDEEEVAVVVVVQLDKEMEVAMDLTVIVMAVIA